MTDRELLYILIGINILIFVLFIFLYKSDRTRLLNGTIFNIFILSISVTIIMAGFIYDNFIIRILMLMVLIPFIIILLLGTVTLIIGTIANGLIVLKKEKRRLSNLLTLLFGIFLFAFIIVNNIFYDKVPFIIQSLLIIIEILVVYFILSFFNYYITTFLYRLIKPKLNKDYIIVLGSGLIDGDKVSKLLGSRIDKAIDFYKRQEKNKKSSKIIFSGGQGIDETISEGEAMKNYALNKGMPIGDIIVEDKSTTTYENFLFSKKIIEEKSENNVEVVFSTSDYHVFRAAIYAKKVGLNIVGMGAKTAKYYLPNAYIREYIAILVMNKKKTILKIGIIVLVWLVITVLKTI